MAGKPGPFFSAAASPPSHNDPLLHPLPAHDWELLFMPTMSSSTLLAHGHGLGLGFPRSSAANLPRFQRYTGGTVHEENEGIGGNSVSDEGKDLPFYSSDGSSLPLDVSQIAVMCSSTSSVEPFTEGWKPHFRIAGAPLQENYYPQDPFAAPSNTGGFLEQSHHHSEPFLAMEQRFVKEPFLAVEEALVASQMEGEQGLLTPENTERAGNPGKTKSPQEQEDDEELLAAQEKAEKSTAAVSELAETGKAHMNKSSKVQGKRSWWVRQTFFYRKSRVVWSAALTAALLGVFFVTHRLYADRHELLLELSNRDESLNDIECKPGLKEAIIRRWRMAVT